MSLYSSHIFLFPFRWDFVRAEHVISDSPFSDRSDEEKFEKGLNRSWRPFKEQKESPIEFYNDAMFFYDSVRESIFGNLKKQKQVSKKYPVVINYAFELKDKDTFRYKIWTKKFGTFDLALNKIRLNVYAPGVGILAFHLSNDKEVDSEKILRINDFGRRLFPSFLTVNTDKNTSLLKLPQEEVLPIKIEIIGGAGETLFEEAYTDFAQIRDNIEQSPNILPNGSQKLLTSILGENFTLEAYRNPKKDEIVIRPSMDDRMFAVCWYGNDKESQDLKWDNDTQQYGFQDYQKSSFWLRFLFMEHGEGSAQSRLMRRQLADKHTYHRWAEYGTFYGVSRTTFICLTDESDYAREKLSRDVRRPYMEMAQLALAQHAATIRFSDEVALLRKHYDGEPLSSVDIQFLHRKYLEFVNHIFFRSITPFEQGQELYMQLQASLDIEHSIAKLDQEVEEFNHLVNRIETEKRDTLNVIYAAIAAFLLPASLIAGILGMNTLGDNFEFYGGEMNKNFCISLVFLFVVSGIIFFGGKLWLKKKGLI